MAEIKGHKVRKSRRKGDADSNINANEDLETKTSIAGKKERNGGDEYKNSEAEMNAKEDRAGGKMVWLKKRKREEVESENENENEIEIDLDKPKPLSKKEMRKLKKARTEDSSSGDGNGDGDNEDWEKRKHRTNGKDEGKGKEKKNCLKNNSEHSSQHRSKYGIWIGNLAFEATKEHLLGFFETKGDITRDNILRINLPVKAGKCKGFAYIDFKSVEDEKKAVGLSEVVFLGRNVLIKGARDFSGRPCPLPPVAAGSEHDGSLNAGKSIFVGNLPFEVTREELTEHFAFAARNGKAEGVRVRLATFEDSPGKCRGFAHVDFGDMGSARRAVEGKSLFDNGDEGGDDVGKNREGKEEVKWEKHLRKRRNNRFWFKGRKLKIEFSVGQSREGKREKHESKVSGEMGKRERKKEAKVGDNSKNVASMTGSIVESKGKRITFDETD